MAEQVFPEPTVGALILSPDNSIFLMSSHKWRGAYVMPGGHIELGESMEQALIREVKEETSLDIFDISFLCFQEFVFGPSYWKKRHFLFFDFVCRTDNPVVELNDEAQEYCWIDPLKLGHLWVESYTMHAIKEFIKKNKNR